MNASSGQPGFPIASLLVGDLHPEVNEATLYEKFSQAGPVVSIRVCRDQVTRRSLGYAYVNFQQPADAERALDTMNSDVIRDRPCRIMWSQLDPSLRRFGVGSIFIKNLAKAIDNKTLFDTFSAFGNIFSCKVAQNEMGESKGYGFVHFETQEAADTAIKKVHGMLLNGKKVVVGTFKQRYQGMILYIKNLEEGIDDAQLREEFNKFGTIISAKVMRDERGATKGFGFVCFSSPEEATKAVTEMNGRILVSKPLYVTLHQCKEERQALLNTQRAHRMAPRFPGPGISLSDLTAMGQQEQKQLLGERLYLSVINIDLQFHDMDLAGKITGMLLEMDNADILHLLESQDALREKVQEAIAVLEAHKQTEGISSQLAAAAMAEEEEKKEEEEEARKWQPAYEESLKKHGSVSVVVARSIFIGPPEVGKSSLKHLLVYNTPKAVKTSTAVMDAPEVVTKQSEMEVSSEQYAVKGDTSAWQLVTSDIMKKSLYTCIANEAYEEKDQYPIEMEAEETEDGQHTAVVEEQKDTHPLPEPLKTEQDQSDVDLLDEQYFQLPQEMVGEGKQIKLKDAYFIHLLDTGGQPSFQDVLPLLLDVPCTYIQVFNAALSLDEPVPITYRCDDHTRVRLEDAEPGRCMMQRSFSSMYTMAQKCSKRLVSFQQEGSPLPKLRIFVVGTHKDQLIEEGRLDKATKDIANFLEEELDGKPYHHSIEWDSSAGQPFFLIDTMAGMDDRASVHSLREGLSKKEASLKLDVPVAWFICQETTRCIPKKFFRFEDLKAFCLNHGFVDRESADSQFRALLQLLSLLGFYSFFNVKGIADKDNFVCTDTGVFLKEVSKLLAVQFARPTSGCMREFKNTGIFVNTPQLYRDLKMTPEMDQNWFLGSLHHLGIAAQVPCKDGLERYFIPAALPQSSTSQKPTPSVAPLCFTYTTKGGHDSSGYSYMPHGVFCRLAVELRGGQGLKLIEKKNTRTLLQFRWAEFMIFLKESPGYISIIPQVVEETLTLSELHTRCENLCQIVKHGLSISTNAVLGSHFGAAELAVGFECPCKKVDMPHLAVPSDTGNSLDCCMTYYPQRYTNKQRIWFSSVDGVELKRHHDEELDISVLEDSACSEQLAVRHSEGTARPCPTHLRPQSEPDQADQVLCHFRDRFISEVDANAIVFDLEHEGIIPNGVLTAVSAKDATLQNQILYAHLVTTSTRDSLMTVCDKIIGVSGNPKMRALGKDMKSMLAVLSRGALSTQPTPG